MLNSNVRIVDWESLSFCDAGTGIASGLEDGNSKKIQDVIDPYRTVDGITHRCFTKLRCNSRIPVR